jgi:hypothetical protein
MAVKRLGWNAEPFAPGYVTMAYPLAAAELGAGYEECRDHLRQW